MKRAEFEAIERNHSPILMLDGRVGLCSHWSDEGIRVDAYCGDVCEEIDVAWDRIIIDPEGRGLVQLPGADELAALNASLSKKLAERHEHLFAKADPTMITFEDHDIISWRETYSERLGGKIELEATLEVYIDMHLQKFFAIPEDSFPLRVAAKGIGWVCTCVSMTNTTAELTLVATA